MSWRLKKKAQALVAGEEGVVRKEWGGRVSVALVYPNTYAVGMSNLAFRPSTKHLNRLPAWCASASSSRIGGHRRVRANRDRALLARVTAAAGRVRPDRLLGHLRGDYINAVRLLRMAGIPARAADRRPDDPVVVMGGVCAFSNPEPMAPFMDVIVVGEARRRSPRSSRAWHASRTGAVPDARRRFVRRAEAARRPPYVPGAYAVSYAADGRVGAVKPLEPGVPPVVAKRRLRDVNAFETRSIVKRPRPSTATCSSSRSARAAGAAVASASRARCTAGAPPESRVAPRVGGGDREGVQSAWAWWGRASRTTRGSAS